MAEKKNAKTGSETALTAPRKQYMLQTPLTAIPSLFKRVSAPEIIKPADIPVDGYVVGILDGIQDSPITTIKGKLLLIKLGNLNPQGKLVDAEKSVLVPCTGVIRSALAGSIKDDGKDDGALRTALEKHLNHGIILRRLEDSTSKKYKKTMFMFDVFVTPDTATLLPPVPAPAE